MHVELTNGNTAELRDISTLTEGDAEDLSVALYDSIPREPNGQPKPNLNPMRFNRASARAVLVAVVESWTLPFPVPTADDLNGFRQLSVEDAAILTKATAPYRATLTPDFTVSEDEASPTSPSDG